MINDSRNSHIPIANRILGALPRERYPVLFSRLEAFELCRGQVLYRLGGPVRFAFFPMSGMVSLLSVTQGGLTTQIGMVGREGAVGIPAILGVNKSPYQVIVQMPGRAMRVRAEVLASEFNRDGPLRDLMLRYIHSLISQISQSALCNRFHTIEERLCRWLLISDDRLASGPLLLTQEALSHMLGSTRTNVTAAAVKLRTAGAIHYRRGKIEIVDRELLKASSCECYRIVTEAIVDLRA